MTDTDFHWSTWLIVSSIGLPAFAFTVWKRWRQAQSGLFWRAVICAIVATNITPFWVGETFGEYTTVDIEPAVAVVPSAILSMFEDGQVRLLEAIPVMAFVSVGILVVSLVLLAIWSGIISFRSQRTNP